MRGGAEVMQVGGDHLALRRRPRAVGARQRRRARLGIPGNCKCMYVQCVPSKQNFRHSTVHSEFGGLRPWLC